MGLFDSLINSGDYTGDKMFGIAMGVVMENWSKDFPGKVKVELDMGEEGKNSTGWIPVMTPYGGKEFGMYTLPEVGSHVVVAFNMGERSCPVVIGNIWDGGNAQPPKTANEKNTAKLFKTKGGNSVLISDEQDKAKIDITTAGKFGVTIDDDAKSIILHDADNKNLVTVDAKGGQMTLCAEKKLVIKVGNKEIITVDGTSGEVSIKTNKISLEGSQGLAFKGMNDQYEGMSVKFTAKSQLEVSSNGITTIKGTMVKIN